MTKKQAHIILYTLWECGYLDKNFTEPHSEYDWAVDLLINPPNKYSYEYREWDEDYSVQKISKIDMRKAKEIQPDLYQGCYFLFSNKKLVYVGVSNCIYSRLKQHTNENIKEWDTVKFIEEHDRDKQFEMENNFIKKYKPKYNKAGTKKHTKQ